MWQIVATATIVSPCTPRGLSSGAPGRSTSVARRPGDAARRLYPPQLAQPVRDQQPAGRHHRPNGSTEPVGAGRSRWDGPAGGGRPALVAAPTTPVEPRPPLRREPPPPRPLVRREHPPPLRSGTTKARNRDCDSGPSSPSGDGSRVEHRGFEPLTSSMRTKRATNCANAPTLTRQGRLSGIEPSTGSAWRRIGPSAGTRCQAPTARRRASTARRSMPSSMLTSSETSDAAGRTTSDTTSGASYGAASRRIATGLSV